MAAMTVCQFLVVSVASAAEAPSAADIVRAAWDNWRGVSSYSEITMTIHRPDWERRMSMRVWTQGQSRSLVRVTAPSKDAGNATLLIDKSMWTYSPKVNRIIKIPSSMMNQNWMGSDFSNKDVARSDDILDQYDHELIEIREHDGLKVYVIDSIPHEEAAVVWGKETLHIREDFVILVEEFYDQDGVLVKGLKTLEIAEIGGRTIASRQRMQKVEAPGEWTEIEVHDAEYDIDVDPEVFTRANLRNPRT
jgi:outer membrane lipoprotein-sorting protein